MSIARRVGILGIVIVVLVIAARVWAQGLDDAVRAANPSAAAGASSTLVASAGAGIGLGLPPTTGTVAVHSWLNVRLSPWGPIVGRLHGGDAVTILERVGDWLRVMVLGRVAFVHGSYVRTGGQKPARAPEAGGETGSSATGSSPLAPVHRPVAAAVESWYVAPMSSPPAPGEGRFGAVPAERMPARVGWEFGPRDLNRDGVFTQHNGIDLTMPSGTRLNAMGDGRVVRVNYDPGGGLAVRIRYDNGYESWYCHLQSVAVHVGDRVAIGQEVARSDSTGQHCMGPHLHMGMRQGGRWIDPRTVPGINLPARR